VSKNAKPYHLVQCLAKIAEKLYKIVDVTQSVWYSANEKYIHREKKVLAINWFR